MNSEDSDGIPSYGNFIEISKITVDIGKYIDISFWMTF